MTRTSQLRRRMFCGLLLLHSPALGALAAPPSTAPAGPYVKHEFQIPMRDGVKLFTSVYVPRDVSRPHPIMLLRTPYSVAPYGPDRQRDELGPSQHFTDARYIFAYQDVRGRFMSEGEFVNMRPHRPVKTSKIDIDESTDTFDTIDWLVKNVANNNGRVGMWGVSYPGFYAAAGMIDSHPALKAVSPQAPIADWFVGDDFHHNGAFFLFDAFDFFSVFGLPRTGPTTEWGPQFKYGTPDAYKFFLDLGPLRNANERHFKDKIAFWNDLMEHGRYDRFWQERNLLPHMKSIRAAVMTVGGWFDAEDLYGPPAIYESVEQNNPDIHNSLVMGPWFHGAWERSDGESLGDISFGAKTSLSYQSDIEFPFFDHYLNNVPMQSLPEAYVFQTGSNRWLAFESWPPAELSRESLYFHADGRLSFEPPREAREAFDEYVSDPARPVPYTAAISTERGRTYMIEDQRFAAHRPDVLVYQTDPLTDALSIAGPIAANLFVSTTGTDADFVVKLIDVFPDDAPDSSTNRSGLPMGGYQMLVRAEVMRARFRNSFEKPEPLVPGRVTPVRFELRDACHTFRPRHRIMVQIQSSWFPLVDRNPQTYVDIYAATEKDFKKAAHRVHRSADCGSYLVLGVIR